MGRRQYSGGIDMSEPKILPPSLRDQKRYIIFEIISEAPVEYGNLVNAIWNSMLDYLGEAEAAEARMWLIQNLYDEKKQRGIIKCKHDYVEKMRAALSLIQIIGETRCIIKIDGVTGTIKSAKLKYMAE
jgi:ribonuclease P/MRP protein subunit POP5